MSKYIDPYNTVKINDGLNIDLYEDGCLIVDTSKFLDGKAELLPNEVKKLSNTLIKFIKKMNK